MRNEHLLKRPIFRSPLAGCLSFNQIWLLPVTAGRFADPNFRGGKFVLHGTFLFFFFAPLFATCLHNARCNEY